MKVHHITEAPRVEPPKLSLGRPGSAPKTSALPKSVDIKPGILDPKGNKIFNVVDQNGKILKSFTGASAEADANAHRDKLTKQITAKKQSLKAVASVKPGTPTRDQLSRGQQRKLAKTGKIKIKGQTYTTKEIAKATVHAKNLNKDQNQPKADNKKDSKIKKVPKGFFAYISGIVKFLSIGGLGKAIQVALNVPQLEDAFDAYLRSLAKAGMTDTNKCRTIGKIKKDGSNVPMEVAKSYTKVVELTAELIFETLLGSFAALSSPAAYALAAALFVKLGIVSGGVTVVLSMIAGGAWLIGGPALIRSCFDALGVMDKIENFIAEKFLGLESSCRWANAIDALQKLGNIPGQVITPNLFGESEEIVKEKSSSAIKSDLEKIIKSDPKILAAYKKGKKLKPKFDSKLKAN